MARQPHFWHIAGCVLDTAARTQSAVAAGTLIQTQRALEPTLSATFGDVAEVTDSLTVDLPEARGFLRTCTGTTHAPEAARRPDTAFAPTTR